MFLPHTIKKVKLKLSQLNRNTETTFSTEKAKRRKKPVKNEAFFRHIRKQTFPTVSNIGNRGKDPKAILSAYSVARFNNRTYSAEIPCLKGQPPPASTHILSSLRFRAFLSYLIWHENASSFSGFLKFCRFCAFSIVLYRFYDGFNKRRKRLNLSSFYEKFRPKNIDYSIHKKYLEKPAPSIYAVALICIIRWNFCSLRVFKYLLLP